MRKSLMMIMMMGVLAMVFMAGMGSYFVGKVGNAENAAPLRKELVAIFGYQMENRDDLSVRVLSGEDGEGLVVSFAPSGVLAKDKQRRDRQLMRLANHILGQDAWQRLAFVEVHLNLPGGAVHQSRFDRTPAGALVE